LRIFMIFTKRDLNKMKFIILGGYGNIGQVIVQDLSEFAPESQITITGRDAGKARKLMKKLKRKNINFIKTDILSKNLPGILKQYDVCVNATQYYNNLKVMKACMKAKINYLDLGGLFHMTRKQLKLNAEFKKINKIAVLGCGSTPGITNVLASYAAQFFDAIKSINISFADADFTRYRQKFVLPYTFHTIVDEFMLKPYILKKGKLKAVAPLSGEKMLHFSLFPQEMQNQKGFYTLHSELATFHRSFKEKKLKECSFRVTFLQNFINKIKTLIEGGFASQKKVSLKGQKNKILDVSAKIMDQWLPQQIVTDEEIIRVDLLGKKNGKKMQIVMDAIAKSRGKIPAGTHDTGIPASIIAIMVGKGVINKTGVHPSESCIPSIEFFKELYKRGIEVYLNNHKMNLWPAHHFYAPPIISKHN